MATIHRNILSDIQIEKFLDGDIEWIKYLSSSRSVEKQWRGAKNINLSDFSWIKLPDGRIDINLPNSLTNEIIDIDQIKQLKENLPNYTCNLLINPAKNKQIQDFHQDNGLLDENYYTLLIPLNREKGMGQTEFIDFDVNLNVGDGVLYSGSVWHRGTANLSNKNRYVIYFVFSKDNIEEKWIF